MDPRSGGLGQRQRWLICIPMLVLLASSLSGGPFETKPPWLDGIPHEITEETSRVLYGAGTFVAWVWWWGSGLAPALLHRFLGWVAQGLSELLGGSFGALMGDTLLVFGEPGESRSGAMGRLTSTALGLTIGLLLLPVTVRGLERGLRAVTTMLPRALQRFIAKRVARLVGKALTYVTLSLTAAGALA